MAVLAGRLALTRPRRPRQPGLRRPPALAAALRDCLALPGRPARGLLQPSPSRAPCLVWPPVRQRAPVRP
eukprot:15484087-Alexandrium_andersonii.AAC.1